MNEQTSKLIEQLAQKLGTSAEYLWSVLLKQAPISATTTLIQILATAVFGWVLWKTHKRLCKKESDEKYAESGYEEYGELAGIPMIIGGLLFVIFGVASFLCIEEVISGYFNPEYWALHEILRQLK